MSRISVVINTFNAASILEQCIKSVLNFDEIVICDMYSDDNTLEIAQRYGCKIVMHERTGYVEPARNFAIAAASNPWVLVLDADELVTDNLRNYLYNIITKKDCPTGLLVSRANFFMGKFMRASYPDYQLRFFEKSKADWPSHIHSRPKIDGQVSQIPSKRKDLSLIHLQDSSITSILEKTNIYSDKEIQKSIEKGKNYSILSCLFHCFHRFFKVYFIKGGFLDGRAGFVNAALIAHYKFASISKIWEYKMQGQNDCEKFLSQK
ncbi:glycosyltransferase family 2 protein [uncultured Acetobacteroides sp.]|uniref:glycosyltransferase family 2 protein n=1 Tax=uncultured Acetobacteroides sp. TaxID=1760811 RepID=UPI0029F4C5DC|nr:glycosyltransferase family 2 protein [uncultured Acetobacteroides sp.]